MKLSAPPIPSEYREPCKPATELKSGKHEDVEIKLIEAVSELGKCAVKVEYLNRAIDARDALYR